MSALEWLNPTGVCLEIDPRRLRVAHGGVIREWPLDRAAGGRLSEMCRSRIQSELPGFLQRRQWQPRATAWCALAGHGVSLRRWKVPRTTHQDLADVLRLQLEGEFPLPPDELAWGWLQLGTSGPAQELLVAALKREAVDDYSTLLRGCGLAPAFTLAALARDALSPAAAGEHSLIELGRHESEWLVADAVGPTRLRVLSWGEQRILLALATRAALTPEDADEALARWLAGGDEGAPGVRAAVDEAVEDLAALLPLSSLGRRVFLTGRLAASPAFVALLATRMGISFESLEAPGASASPSALRGIQRLTTNPSPGILRLESRSAEPTAVLSRPAPRHWAIAAAAVFVALLALPHLEALLLGPGLAGRVAAVKAKKDRLEMIDREADFLRYLKQNQASYVDTLFVVGKCTPPGAHVDSLSLNRKGELSLRISMRQPPEVTEFRTKLVDCGFFASVVVEEQSPSQDRQKTTARITAVLKAPAAREGLAVLSTNAPAGGRPPGGPAGGPMPGGPPVMAGGPVPRH